MDVDDFIDEFGRYVDAGEASLFVGAGFSVAPGYPPWSVLVEPFREALGVDPIDDLSQLVQYYQDSDVGSRNDVQDHIAEAIRAVPQLPADATGLEGHRLLAGLPITSTWTTNYDPLLEESITPNAVIAEDEQLAQRLAPGARRILKMHGSVPRSGEATDLVIARSDFERYPESHPRFWRLLTAEFLTKSLLFLGFSLADPNMEQVLRLARLLTADAQRQHFAVMRRPDANPLLFDLKCRDFEAVGIEVVEIAEFSEINPLLRRLVARCRPSRLYISGSPPTGVSTTSGSAYPTRDLPPELEGILLELGARMADTPIRLMSGSQVGATVGYEMLRRLRERGEYDPDRFLLVRRTKDAPLEAPNERLGRLVFTGEDPSELRGHAFDEVRALLVIGGRAGTADEVQRARDLEMGVVPLAATGGTALEVWDAIGADFGSYRLGGRHVDPDEFELLAHSDWVTAVAAAVRLAKQALFL